MMGVFVWMFCPTGTRIWAYVVGIWCADHWAMITCQLELSNNNKKAHYENDTLLHIIVTHSLAHNTLPALQKTGAHSYSGLTAFWPRIHSVNVDKFSLLGNGHVSLNGNPLYCPYFTLPGYRARTSVVGVPCHNPYVAGICLVLQTYQAKPQLSLNKLCYMPSAPTYHLILLPALLTLQYSLNGHSIPPIIGRSQ